MLQPINKKLTIDYQPNKSLFLEYRDAEIQEKYAWYAPYYLNYKKQQLPIFFYIVILYLISLLGIPLESYFLAIVPLPVGFVFLVWFKRFLFNAVYGYQIQIKPNSIEIDNFNEKIKNDLESNLEVKIEIEKLSDSIQQVSINFETFNLPCLENEMTIEQHSFVINALSEILDLELTKTEKSTKFENTTILIYQSKT